jgi:hypothetical protein
MSSKRKDRILELIQQVNDFQLCSPSDDPDEQTAVTVGYRHLLVQLQTLAPPILPEQVALRLKQIDMSVDDIYSVYAAKAQLDAVILEIEEVLEHSNGELLPTSANVFIVDPALITRMEALTPSTYDVASLVRMCREINSSFAHGNVLAVALLMRTVLNHVPPVFGYSTFEQVVANVGKSLKESFEHLENGLRKIADFHTHRKIVAVEAYPSAAQVEPYKPQFELLLQQVESRLKIHGKNKP